MNLDTILTEESLSSPCEKCEGSGKINPPESSNNSPPMTDMWESDGIYQTQCPNCPDCNGTGIKLTPAGKVLKDFIKNVIPRTSSNSVR